MQVGRAIARLESEQLNPLETKLVELRHVALRQRLDDLPICVDQARLRRRIMGLGHVREVLAVRRDVYRVRETWISEPSVARPIQSHSMELQLHVVVAVARHVVEQAMILIDSNDSMRIMACSTTWR